MGTLFVVRIGIFCSILFACGMVWATDNFTSVSDNAGKMADSSGIALGGASAVVGCLRNKAILDGAITHAKQYIRWETNVLGPLSSLLNAVSIFRAGRAGNYLEGGQTAAAWIIDEAFCSVRPDLCPAWAAGLTIGQIINTSPVWAAGTDRTINDAWTDLIADLYTNMTSKSRPSNSLNAHRAFIANRRSEVDRIRTRAADDAKQCTLSENEYAAAIKILGAAGNNRSAPITPIYSPHEGPVKLQSLDCKILDDYEKSKLLMQRDRQAWGDLNARC